MTAQELTALAPGNTKQAPTLRARAFQFTLNQTAFYDDLIESLRNLKTCDYCISCKEEAPTTGHEHIHIYAHFSQTYKISKKIMKYGAHIEICKGSPKQNIAYIRKDGNILDEWGDEPHQGLKTVSELKETSIDEVAPQYYKIKKEIDNEETEKEGFFQMLEEIEKDELKGPQIIYITGEPGKGKTYLAYKTAMKHYAKEDIGRLQINNNFCKFTNDKAKCFVIEEFRPSQMHASDFLQLTDKYGYNANIKGGFKYIRPEMIIICSVMDPKDIYHEELNKQFMRRITEIIDLSDTIKVDEL